MVREVRPVQLFALGVALLFMVSAALASVHTQHYDFPAPAIDDQDGSHRVTMDGTWSLGSPGEPVLPVAGGRILLPPGEIITHIEIIPGERVTLEGEFQVAPGQHQAPLSFEGPLEMIEPDPAIYDSADPFPCTLTGEQYTGVYRGYRIVTFPLHPVQYQPQEGTLSYFRNLGVVVTTPPSADALAQTARMIRHDQTILQLHKKWMISGIRT